MAGLGDGAEDLVELVGETLFEHTIGFVENHDLDCVDLERRGVAHKINETTRSGDDDVGALLQLLLLLARVETTNRLTESDVCERGELLRYAETLQRQFTCRHKDCDTGGCDLLRAV